MARKKITLEYMLEKKSKGEKMARTALYDYLMATIAEDAGIEIINVGDSIANCTFGYDSTIKAKLDVMIEHAKAVRKGAPSAYIMGDMPWMSYQANEEEALRNASRYILEADMDCVKVEGGMETLPVIRKLDAAGIPVIAHTGLTPQSASLKGGMKTAGRSALAAIELVKTVDAFVEAGATVVTVETVPIELARILYERCPTLLFGTGMGVYTDAPFINIYDMCGFYPKVPRFVKVYANAREVCNNAISAYVNEVKSGAFPAPKHEYHMVEGEEEKLQELLSKEGLL